MLINYLFDNFCSFDKESEFSMEAPRGKVKQRFPDNYIRTTVAYDILKTAVIVGENAGGKSNFINSLRYLKSLFDTNSKVQSVNSYINADSLINDQDPKQKFDITFIADNHVIYEYELIIDTHGIFYEKLLRCNHKKAISRIVFAIKRNKDEEYVMEDGNAKEVEVVLKNSNNSYGLFISKLALLGNQDSIATVEWILNTLYPGMIPSEYDEDLIKKEADLQIMKDKRYIEILRMVDYSICGIEIDEDKPYSETLIIRKDADGKTFKRKLALDSAGVREFFAWAVQIFRVVYENKIIFADEMDRVLNPILSDRVIAYINGMEHHGQFIFSTHNVLHLNLKTYMKEQIYFVTKSKENLTSELYSLADFPEVRYEKTNIYEFYMKGILGGTAFE